MFATGCRNALPVALLVLCAGGVRAETPMHQKKPEQLLSTVHARYRMVQQDQEMGTESFDRRTYSDNTVVFDVTSTARMSAVTLFGNAQLVLEDESYFPRSFRSERDMVQTTDTTRITYTAEVFSNVVVLESDMRGRKDTRRVVVPAGVPIVELAAVYSWYQILFWTDLTTRDHQRFQWLDPQRNVVESGEIYVAGKQTIKVLGKETPVTVLKAERERMGPAQLYVDSQRRIVRCEQNVTVFELVEWSEKK